MKQYEKVTPSISSPLRLLLAVLAVVFLAEVASMALVGILVPERFTLLGDVADALLLIVLSGPFLWFFIVRPLRSAAVAEHMRAATVIAHAPDGIITVNEQGLVVSFNAAAERIFGYGNAEVLEKPVTQLVPERYREAHQKGFERARASGEPGILGQTVELDGLRKDGHEFPMELSLATWTVGKQKFYTWIVRDISESKEKEEALRAANETLRALIRASPLAITVLDPAGNVRLWNPAAERIFGWHEPEVLGRSLPFVPETKQEDFTALRERVLQGELLAGVELRRQRRDGTPIDVSLWAGPLHDAKGDIIGIVGILADITERKRSEEALAESEKRYHSLFENMLDGFAYCRMLFEDNRPQDFIYLAVNSAFEKLTGLKNVVGRRVTEAIPGIRESHPELFETYGRVALTGRPERFELYFKPLESWLSISVHSVEKEHFVAVFDNITERKQAETALMERTRQLEAVRAVSAEVTRELDLPMLLGLIHQRAADLVGTASGAVFLLDEAAQVLVPQAWHGMGDWFKELRLRLGEGIAGRVAERRVGMIVNDYRSWPHAIALTLEHTGITAILAEPLLYRDRLLGVITINAEGTERSFTESDRELLALFATQAAIAIENARLFQQEQDRRHHVEVVRTISEEITRELDLTRLLRLLQQRSVDLVGGATGVLYLWDEAAQVLVPRVWTGHGEWMAEVRLRPGEGVAGTVAQRRQGMIVNDFRTSPYAFPLFVERLTHTAVVVEPLLYQDRLLGVITIANDGTGRTFTEADRETLALFASQAAIAIENVRLYSEALEMAERLEGLTRTSAKVAGTLRLEEVLDAIAEEAAKLLRIEGAGFRLLEGDRLVVRGRYGLAHHVMLTPSIRVGESLSGLLVEQTRPIAVPDIREDPQYLPAHKAAAIAHGVVAFLGVPVRYRDRAIGVLNVYGGERRSFSEWEVHLLRVFADHAAIAIENARLYDATVRQLSELQALHDTGLAITSSLTLDEQLEILVQRLGQAAQAQRILVVLVDPEDPERFHQCLAYDATKPDPWLRHLDLASARYPEIQEAIRTGQPLVIPDVAAAPQLGVVREHLDLRSLIVVPFIVQERAIGAVSLGYMGQGRTFPPEEISLLQSFAAQAAIAIEKARIYQEIQQHAAELEQRVHERTRELEAANEQLQEASRHKSEFLATMSHELRTPLNSIIGFAELVGEQRVGALNEKQARYLGHIHNSGKHLLQLISDILDLSKVEAGKFALQPEVLPVATTLEDILVITRGLANKKQQELSAEIEANLPPLRADPVRFKQILFNLLSNAVKFTPEGGTVRVTARRITGAGDGGLGTGSDPQPPAPSPQPPPATGEWLELAVADTGIGIKPEDLPRLFQEFVQLEATASKRHEGTGLGLALTKRLVEMHGGRIWAESEGEGRGSTFTVILPFEGPGEPPNGSGSGPSQ